MTEEKKQKNNDEIFEYQEEAGSEESQLNLDKKLEKIENKLDECRKEKDEYLLGWQRTKADFLNYKNDEKRRTEELKQWLKRDCILGIIPILDDFEKSLIHLPDDLKEKEWTRGIIQIKDKFKTALKELGLEEIKTVGEKFNPELHEAIEEIESDKESGVIVEELEKGYTLNNAVIKPARVKISKNMQS